MSTTPDRALVAGTTQVVLDGHAVYETVPLGALLRYFDGAPRPPERFTKKLRAWKSRNGTARLVEKASAKTMGSATYPASFTLHEGDFGSNGVIVMVVRSIHHVTTELRFAVIEQPQPGTVRVLSRWNGRDEFKHLAPDMAAAEAWMARAGYVHLVAEIVGDEALPAQMGRAA